MKTIDRNRHLIRRINTNTILRALKELGSVSQIDISRETSLSAGTVTNIVRDLKKARLVKKDGVQRTAAGRRPVLLRLNPEARHIVGVELTAEQVRIALMDWTMRVVDETEYAMDPGAEAAPAVGRLCREAHALIENNGVAPDRVLGLGVGVEGVVDAEQRRLLLTYNLGWSDVPLADLVKAESGFDTIIDMSANAMALGEYLYGAGQNSHSMLLLDVDSGIGAIPVIEGRVIRGANNMVGQMGHALADPDGEKCVCGRRGCLETVAAGRAVVRQARNALKHGEDSAIPKSVLTSSAPRAIRLIARAARQGDALARRVFESAALHIGRIAAEIVNVLDPELVIMTGYVVSESEGLLSDLTRDVVSRNTTNRDLRKLEIREGALGVEATVIGAGAMVCEEAFRSPVEGPRIRCAV